MLNKTKPKTKEEVFNAWMSTQYETLSIEDLTLDNPIYDVQFDEKQKRAVIIYKKELSYLGGRIKLFAPEVLVIVEGNKFMFNELKAFLEICFPDEDISAISRDDAKAFATRYYNFVRQGALGKGSFKRKGL